ncbi:MAG: ATP-binding protein [Erysipelotrichaceae bacterium]|jgi:predicted AAA+ superfamily ATPase|nr:ATP-binding protein [Erysipelotrichaceae bacterium]
MKRKALQQMKEWKDRYDRKPLVLEGARQVGKTWLMREFGRLYFDDVAAFNFDENEALKDLFRDTKNPQILIEKLGLIHGKAILPGKTLIIFDEIQASPDALNSLKYFREKANEYIIVSAGSLLGVYLASGHSHPVGQVDILQIYPLSFEEFLEASDSSLFEYYSQIRKDTTIDTIFHNRLNDLYLTYLIVGGLPECVQTWIKTKDASEVAQKQKDLLTIYERDFSKHYEKVSAARILMVYRNIPTQLAKTNNKFIYKDIQKGARARSFEEAIEWLVTAGIVNRLYLTRKNESPLNGFTDLSSFKLYLFDTGLLKAMADIPNEQIVLNKDYQFKGSLTENYVLQQLKTILSSEPKYFTFEKYEIDFMIQDKSGNIIPLEVKAKNSVSSVSLNAYNKRFVPKLRIRYSMLNYKKDENMINIPLYLIGKTTELI